MAGEPGRFMTQDGQTLHYERWQPEDPAVCSLAVVFLHGTTVALPLMSTVDCQALMSTGILRIARRCGCCDSWGESHCVGCRACSAGIEFWCLEHLGHGRSDGINGLVNNFSVLQAHAIGFCRHVVGATGRRLGVMSHSMGGAVAMYIGDTLASEYRDRFVGVAALAPAVLGAPVNLGLKKVVGCLARCWPQCAVGPVEHPEVYDTGSALGINYSGRMMVGSVDMFINDIFPRTQRELAREPEARKQLRLGFRCLILCGSKDRVVPCAGLQRLAESGDETELVILKGKDHQPMLHKGWERVADQMCDWLLGGLR